MTPKFRAWLLAEKKMVRVSAITFFSIGKLEGKVMEILYLSESHNRFLKIWAKDPERFVLMQSTGVLDIDGKEIYEGDVVLPTDGGASLVHWKDGAFLVGQYGDMPYVLTDFTSLVIIGNIYENPELASEFIEEED